MAANESKVEEIFFCALTKESAEELAAYLDEACKSDESLRSRVQRLLDAEAKLGSFLQRDAADIVATIDQPVTEKPGTQIGPYKLLQQIGEGGMGVVYLAEQKEPVKRRVALKIIKPGMDTRQVIARFEAERQALAMMDHPNIAKVLDAGQTDSGRPYFVMELVSGLPVTKYCDEQHLTPKERLELFVPICQAVQHAHQKGIIHRDLKPSNIMVALYDGQAIPKIIDFGVAKATNQTLTEKTMFTMLGQVVGTLEYMSPEQAERNQLDIDTRSDIYSLGVVLYELLTGETPFDRERLRSAAFDEMLRIIREEEPSKPSTKVSGSQSLPSIAANRRTEPAKLGSTIRGELDWIVLKALEKDRARRYETATGLANDIERYLHDEAVVACPPSAAYRFRKFARRNKFAIGTASVIAISLVVGMIGTTWQAHRAKKAEVEAVEFAAEAQAQAERANQEAEKSLRQAAIAQYLAEGNYELAEREVLQELESRQTTLGDEHVKTLATMNILAIIYQHQGRRGDAEHLLKQKLDVERRTVGEDHPTTIQTADFLANLYRAEGRHDESEQLHRRVLEFRSQSLGDDHPETLQAMKNLAAGLRLNGDLKGAIDMYQDLLKLDSESMSVYMPLVRVLQHSINTDEQQGRAAEMLTGLRRLVALLRDPPAEANNRMGALLLEALTDLGAALRKAGHYDEAESAHREALEVWQRLVNDFPDDKYYSRRLGNISRQLGYTLSRKREYVEALTCFEKAVQAAPDNYRSHYDLASFRLDAADASFHDAELAARHAADAVKLSPKLGGNHRLLGLARHRQGDWAGAVESLTKAVKLGLPADARSALHLSICYAKLGDQKQAAEWYGKGAALLDQDEEQSNPWLSKLRETAANLLGNTTAESDD